MAGLQYWSMSGATTCLNPGKINIQLGLLILTIISIQYDWNDAWSRSEVVWRWCKSLEMGKRVKNERTDFIRR